MKNQRLYESTALGANGSTTPPVPAPGTTPNLVNPPANTHWSSSMEGLADGVKGNASLQTFKTPAEAIKAYVDVQPLIGRDKVVLPKDWNDATQVKEFNTRMGVPEKADAYDLVKHLNGNDKLKGKFDDKRVAAAQDMFLEAGCTPRQAQKLAEKYIESEIAMVTEMNQKVSVERSNALNKFKTERGSAYDTDLALAHKALVSFGGEDINDVLKVLDQSGFGDDPRFIKIFAKIGATLKEGTAHTGGQPGVLQTNSVDSARVRKSEMMSDQTFQKNLTDPNQPGHKAAVEEWTKVNGLIPARNGQ